MVVRRALLIAFTNSRKPAIVISLLLSFSGCTSEPDSVAESTIDQGGATIVEAPLRPSAIEATVAEADTPADGTNDEHNQDRLSIVEVPPLMSAALKNSDRVRVRVAYDLQSTDTCRIFVRPTIDAELASGYGAHGSGNYERGRGEATGWFTMNQSVDVDGIRVTMVDVPSGKELRRLSVPVNAKWSIDKQAAKVAPAAAGGSAAEAKPASPVALNEGAPPIDALDMYSERVSLEQYRGQVVLLEFWATWCGPCIAELPNVKEVFGKHGGETFAIVGVSLDSDRDRLVNFIEDNDMPWTQVFDGQGWKNSTGVS